MDKNYRRFIDQLRTIEVMTNNDIFPEKKKRENSFSEKLNEIIMRKERDAFLSYSILENNNLEVVLDSIEEVHADKENKKQEFLEDWENDKEEFEQTLKGNRLLEKACSKINFKIIENESDYESKLDINPNESDLINYILEEVTNNPTAIYELYKGNIMFESNIIILCTYLETLFSNIIKDHHLYIHQGDLKKKIINI